MTDAYAVAVLVAAGGFIVLVVLLGWMLAGTYRDMGGGTDGPPSKQPGRSRQARPLLGARRWRRENQVGYGRRFQPLRGSPQQVRPRPRGVLRSAPQACHRHDHLAARLTTQEKEMTMDGVQVLTLVLAALAFVMAIIAVVRPPRR